MPALSPDTEQHKAGTFNYSATRLSELGASEYTLVTIVNDVSGSVSSFKPLMENAIKQSVMSCRNSPRADNLMIRCIHFGDYVTEFHGFKLLSSINDSDYDNCLTISGSTALFDGTENAIQATKDYAEKLDAAGYKTNGVIFVITDGGDNVSVSTATKVKKSLEEVRTSEKLESLVVVLIGVNIQNSSAADKLDHFHKVSELNQYIELDKADAKTLAKLAAFVSKSISATSQSLGSGSVSKQFTSGKFNNLII